RGPPAAAAWWIAMPCPGARHLLPRRGSARPARRPTGTPAPAARATARGAGVPAWRLVLFRPFLFRRLRREAVPGLGQRRGQFLGRQHARLLVHLRDGLDVLVGGHGLEVAELARGRQYAPFERGHRLVVGVHGLAEALAHAHPVLAQPGDALVEVLAEPCDLGGIDGQRLLPPAIGHGAQQRDQRGGRGGDHLLADAVLDQRGILL